MVIEVSNKHAEVVTRKVSLSSTQILSVNSIPIELLPAPGTGKTYAILEVQLKLNYGTATYAGGTTINIQFANAGLTILSQATILASTTSRMGIMSRTATSGAIATQYLENTAVYITTAASNPTTGDGTLDVYVTYKIITL